MVAATQNLMGVKDSHLKVNKVESDAVVENEDEGAKETENKKDAQLVQDCKDAGISMEEEEAESDEEAEAKAKKKKKRKR